MWGTLDDVHVDILRARFIPTHVGNTPPGSATGAALAVHPHACGEHQIERCIFTDLSGSSPRMWGTPGAEHRRPALRRFIPTHVGNTRVITTASTDTPVHPHACGEHHAISAVQPGKDGSSPRMWGTLCSSTCDNEHTRFIPTHVGNTIVSAPRGSDIPVHPHACGEHQMMNLNAGSLSGSSPRMWGTRLCLLRNHIANRFIPTHVGNTRPVRRWRRSGTVHPHACGEHLGLSIRKTAVPGSSPRMWGTHLPYNIVFKEEKTPRKIYRLILYSVVRSRGWNATNCSPSNNTGCRRLTPRVWNS